MAGNAPLLDIGVVGPAGDGSVVIQPTGDIDLATVDRLRTAALSALAEYRPRLLVIDLNGVSFLDLSGVSALVEIRGRATAAGGRVTLRAPQPIVYRVLELTNVLGLFES